MRVLGRPETAQALGALAGGQNPAVPAGPTGTPVPANAYAGLLSALAREAEAEALSWDQPARGQDVGYDEYDEVFDEYDEYDEVFDEYDEFVR
jgi:hypothetical protein